VKQIFLLRARTVSAAVLFGATATPLTVRAQAPAAAVPSAVTAPPPAWGAATASASGKSSVANASYRLAVEDIVDIAVVDRPELSKSVQVRPDGKISYAFLGEINVVGMTTSELEARIATSLKRQYKRPQVSVSLAKRQERLVSALGAVKAAGPRPMKDNWRLLDLLADAGGLSVERPEWVSATLIRGGSEVIPVDVVKLIAADPAENRIVQTGDILMVRQLEPERLQVQVTGEITKPGPVLAPVGGSIVDVVYAAGGPTPRAALSRATILRNGKTIPVDLSALRTGGKVAEGILIQAGDQLTIPENKAQFAAFGAINRPGPQEYPEDEKLTFYTALMRAGGQSSDADLRKAKLIRPTREGKVAQVTEVNLDAMLKKGDFSKDVPVEPGDIVYLEGRSTKRGFGLLDALSFVPYMSYFIRR